MEALKRELFSLPPYNMALKYLDLAEDLYAYAGRRELGIEIASALLTTCQHEGKLLSFFKEIFVRDISTSTGPLFREENPSILAIKCFFDSNNYPIVLTQWLAALATNRYTDTTTLRELGNIMVEEFHNLIESGSLTALGPILSLLGESLHTAMDPWQSERERRKEVDHFVLSFFFLRFLCPLMLQPQTSCRIPAILLRTTARLLLAAANASDDVTMKELSAEELGLWRVSATTHLRKSMRSLLRQSGAPRSCSSDELTVAYDKLSQWKPSKSVISTRWEPSRVLIPTHVDPRVGHAVESAQVRVYGIVLPTLSALAIVPSLFTTFWALYYETTTVGGELSSVVKEVIHGCIGTVNKAQLCIDLHTTLAMGLGLELETVEQLLTHPENADSQQFANELPDARQILEWASLSGKPRHRRVQQPSFLPEHAPELFSVAFLAHLLSRLANSFGADLTRAKGKFLKARVFEKKRKVIAKVWKRAEIRSGASVKFLHLVESDSLLEELEALSSKSSGTASDEQVETVVVEKKKKSKKDKKEKKIEIDTDDSSSTPTNTTPTSSTTAGSSLRSTGSLYQAFDFSQFSQVLQIAATTAAPVEVEETPVETEKPTVAADESVPDRLAEGRFRRAPGERISQRGILVGEKRQSSKKIALPPEMLADSSSQIFNSENYLSTIHSRTMESALTPFENDFFWLQENEHLRTAFGTLYTLMEQLVKECLPPVVIAKLRASIDHWNAVDRFTEEKLSEFLKDLEPGEAVMARTVITIAQSPRRLSSHLRQQFVDLFPEKIGEQCLVSACVYASFLAVKRIASYWVLPE